MVDIALAAIPVALILAYIPHFVKGKFLIDVLKRYDNVMPREMLHDEKVKSTDTGKMALRAAAAHQNGLEAFASFTAGVLAAKYAGVAPSTTDILASTFLVSRAFYNVTYILNKRGKVALLRTLFWFVGMGSTLTLMYKAATMRSD